MPDSTCALQRPRLSLIPPPARCCRRLQAGVAPALLPRHHGGPAACLLLPGMDGEGHRLGGRGAAAAGAGRKGKAPLRRQRQKQGKAGSLQPSADGAGGRAPSKQLAQRGGPPKRVSACVASFMQQQAVTQRQLEAAGPQRARRTHTPARPHACPAAPACPAGRRAALRRGPAAGCDHPGVWLAQGVRHDAGSIALAAPIRQPKAQGASRPQPHERSNQSALAAVSGRCSGQLRPLHT
jgi:hypothetical protein